jgi:hypothetical protein
MNYLVFEVDAYPADTIRVQLEQQCNVQVMDYTNYQRYKLGQKHDFIGGNVTKTPFLIKAPHFAHWYVVIDLGGAAGSLKAKVELIKA